MPTRSLARYGLYFTPPADHALTRAAARWLGRDAFGGRILPAPASMPPDWEPFRVDPRRYGFHATLKPPMRLKPDCHAWDLQEAMRVFCAARPPVTLGRLQVARIGSFFALVPVDPDADGPRQLADDVVSHFDGLRAPMSPAEFDRRNGPGLDAVEVENLKHWGYAYVFERFRFHMSLTGPVPVDVRADVEAHLISYFAPYLADPLRIDALTVFIEDVPGADFVVLSQCEFARTT